MAFVGNFTHFPTVKCNDKYGQQVNLTIPKTGRNAVVIRPGKIDRSPCGTGCSARMAVLYARGELAIGEPFQGHSIIDSRFDCMIDEEIDLNDISAKVPTISGQAWITGTHQHMLDPSDPWPEGYRLSDTWPGA